jgi:hypothetical protein
MDEEVEVEVVETSDRKFEYPPDFLDAGLPKGVMSPSQFDMYRRCARQYDYRYVQGLIEPPGIAMIKGTAVHKGAEVTHRHTIDTGSPLSVEEAVQEVADNFVEQLEKVALGKDDDPGREKDRAIANFRVYYAQAIPKIHPVAAEKTFAVKIGVVPVRGVIDLIDRVEDLDGGEVEVVSDLKVTGRLWPEQKIACAPQLTFYAIVENTPRVRVDFLVDQKSGMRYEPKRTLRSVSDKRVLTEDLEQVVDLIKKGIFPRCDPTSWACTERFCGYYNKCRGPR